MSFVGRRKTWPSYRFRGGISSKWAYQGQTEKIWAFLVLVQEGPLPATVFGRRGFGYYDHAMHMHLLSLQASKQTNNIFWPAAWYVV
jgi:hypothetical protein